MLGLLKDFEDAEKAYLEFKIKMIEAEKFVFNPNEFISEESVTSS